MHALYVALDEKRSALDMSWAAVARAINSSFRDVPQHKPIALSTITGLRTKALGEGDGILQMLIWLDATPESFVRGVHDDSRKGKLRKLEPSQILRWNTQAIYVALDEKRTIEHLTWNEVAARIGGLNAAALTRMAKGGRTTFPHVMRIVRWLGTSAATFTRASDW